MNVVVDNFSFKVFFYLFFIYERVSIFYIEKKKLDFFFIFFLKLKKNKITYLSQNLPGLKYKNINLYDYIHDLSKKLSEQEIKEIFNKDKFFKEVNFKLKKNSIKLFLLKIIDKEYRYYLTRLFYTFSILGDKKILFILEKPKFILLQNFMNKKKIKYKFYNNGKISDFKKNFLTSFFGIYFRIFIKNTIGFSIRNENLSVYNRYYNKKKNIFALIDNNYYSNNLFRKFPSWKKKKTYNIIAYDPTNLGYEKSFYSNNSFKDGVFYFDSKIFNKTLSIFKKNSNILKLINLQLKISNFFFTNTRMRNFSKEIIIFLNEVQILMCLSLFFKTRVFVSSYTHLKLNLAAEVVSQILNFKTINYQYSFAHSKGHSLTLLSNSDILALFSKKFKKTFMDQNLYNSKIIKTNYIFPAHNDLRIKSNKIRSNLKSKGVKLIIGYFDESVKFNKWNLSTSNMIYQDLKILLEELLKNKNIAVISKPQFVFHQPSKIFKFDKIFQKAKSTGRYIEEIEGNYRNNILPSQISLVSDLTIGYFYGATASFETSLLGKVSFIINPHNNSSKFGKVFDKRKIVFKNMRQIINYIKKNNFGEILNTSRNEWKLIENYLLLNSKNKKDLTQIINTVIDGRKN